MARVVRFHEYGDASVLKIENLDVHPPDTDEVQIEVKSFGLNRAEVMFRTHAYFQEAQFPSRLGFEAAGTVKTVGTSVTGFKKGDVVSVIPPTDIARWGTYGELANVPARNLVKHPENISFEQAAASWMQYVTAWGALIEQAKLTAGEFVIVTAASSSVGIAAFQIAHAVGATTIATTRTRAKLQLLIEHGADHVVVTDEEDLVAHVMELTSGTGARVVFDPVGGPSFIPLTESMARGGILLEYGALSAEPTPFPLLTVLGRSLTLKGFLNGEITNNEAALERAIAFINMGLASGQLKPVIARRSLLNKSRKRRASSNRTLKLARLSSMSEDALRMNALATVCLSHVASPGSPQTRISEIVELLIPEVWRKTRFSQLKSAFEMSSIVVATTPSGTSGKKRIMGLARI